MNAITRASDSYQKDLRKAAAALRKRFGAFEVVVVLGSGFAGLLDKLDKPVTSDFSAIRGFLRPSAPGHRGVLACATVGSKRALFLCGRVHCYEGYSAAQVAFGVRAAGVAGASKLIVTNAAGGINRNYRVGDLVLIDNQLSFWCEDPSRGLRVTELGPYFYDCTHPFDLSWLRRVQKAAPRGLRLRRGVYAMTAGPRFESAAEIRALRTLGADLAGMSTVPEVLAARQMGIKVLGISLVSNLAAGVSKQKLDSAEVLEAGRKASANISRLILQAIQVA